MFGRQDIFFIWVRCFFCFSGYLPVRCFRQEHIKFWRCSETIANVFVRNSLPILILTSLRSSSIPSTWSSSRRRRNLLLLEQLRGVASERLAVAVEKSKSLWVGAIYGVFHGFHSQGDTLKCMIYMGKSWKIHL